jgi:hypothetical protein
METPPNELALKVTNTKYKPTRVLSSSHMITREDPKITGI